MSGVRLQPLNHYNPMTTKLPREIIKPLQALLGRVRRMQVLRGLAAVATVVLGGLLLSMAAHRVFGLMPVVVSWVLLGSIVVGALWAIRTWFVKPLGSRITLVQIARWLETRHPEIQERVSTALELSSDSKGAVSEVLLKELVLEAQGDVKGVDPTVEVRARRAKRLDRSALDSIPGVGPGRKRALLNRFGSTRAVETSGLTDLESVEGISKSVARKIYDYFHPEN